MAKFDPGNHRYVRRLTGAIDKEVGDFTTDGNWKVDGLDLSAIVPAGATAIHLLIDITDDAASSWFGVRKDATHIYNYCQPTTQVANIPYIIHAIVACNADRLLDYIGANLAFTSINVTVLGWFIPQ